jgi:hypothetical protein
MRAETRELGCNVSVGVNVHGPASVLTFDTSGSKRRTEPES